MYTACESGVKFCKRGLSMPLLVKYVNDGIGYIQVSELDKLMRVGAVEAFKRSIGGWVNPKVDPVRGKGSPKAYSGPNRRSRWQ